MAKVYDSITNDLADFITKQPLFFVSTAPLSTDGHVNLSPKGLDCLQVLSPHRVAYLDLTGSGNETSAHLTENRRITFLFCSFAGAPQILRLYGQGTVVLPNSGDWRQLRDHFPDYPGVRQIVVADIQRIQTSCGFAVPLMDYVGQRDTLVRWAEAKGEDGVYAYQQEKNTTSIDNLPAPLLAPPDSSPAHTP